MLVHGHSLSALGNVPQRTLALCGHSIVELHHLESTAQLAHSSSGLPDDVSCSLLCDGV